MKIVQKTYLVEEVEGKEISLVFDSDTTPGSIFDTTLKFKAFCVEKMLEQQKNEEDKLKKDSCKSNECEKPEEE